MLLGPAKTKFKREQRNKLRGKEHRASTNSLRLGLIGIQALESGFITPQQLEALRKSIVRCVLGKSKIWFRLLPATIITSKAKGVRMGRGKGNWKNYAFRLRSGRVIVEIGGIIGRAVRERVAIAVHKLPIRARLLDGPFIH